MNTPNEIEAIVKSYEDIHYAMYNSPSDPVGKYPINEQLDWLRTTLTQLNASRTAEMSAMVREIIAKSNLVENTIKHGDTPIDGSFYQIYRGYVKEIAQAHDITIN